ncbi:MAG: hypothetical protein WC850_05325 [Candidatus Gracilibacteria bacterium]
MQQENIVETKKCKLCSVDFDITDKDLEFYDKISPIFNGKKYSIPSPTLCPDCRQQERLTFRNERKLYKRKCDATGKDIISMYSPDKKYKVYSQEKWWSDSWNALDYGKEFDFSKRFFEQFEELYKEVPLVSLTTDYTKDENSAYTNFAGSNKNCYLIFDSDFNRDCINLSSSTKNENCIDCYSTHNSNFCYQAIGVENCYNCFYIVNSIDCNECYECDSLIGCKNCFGCANLSNSEYQIYNKQYTKEEYIKELTKILETKKIKFNNFLEYPKKFMITNRSENVTGNYIYDSKNVSNSYEIYNAEDCKYCFGVHDIKSSYDVSGFGIAGLDRIYNSHVVGIGGYNVFFSNIVVQGCNNIYYSNTIYNNSSNLFGCVGMVSKQYCILNKQYTKEEYEELVPKIIEHMKKTGEWGEFFPSSISPFGYNETVANEYFPLSKNEAIEKGFKWSDYEIPFPKVEKIIPANMLPDNIKDIPDDILNWAIECELTKKPFKIISQELEFYRKHNLPIPRRHPDLRHLDRMALRNPRKLFDRKCNKCGNDIKTTYSPDKKEIVYCEECYERQVY